MRIVYIVGALLMAFVLFNCNDPAPCPAGTNCAEGGAEVSSPDGGGDTDKGGTDQPPQPTAAQWTETTSGTQVDLYGVSMPTATQAWVVGGQGTILHTEDGGKTWKAQTSGVTETLRGVSFININNGWVVGDKGVVLRTRDGGKQWNKLDSPVSESLRNVQFVDLDTGFAVGDGFSLLRTSNGGDSWNPTSFRLEIDLYGVYFLNKTEGFITGTDGTILKTVNGARDVTTAATASASRFSAVYFLNKDKGWAAGDGGTLLKRTGEGNWQKQDLKTDASFYGIDFGSPKRGWVIGKNGAIFGTQDAGDSWYSEIRKSLPDLQDISAATATAGVIVGNAGTILYLKNAVGECTDGDTRECYTGPDGTKGVGECKAGTQTCSGGIWSTCNGEVRPADKETCFNGKDETCDGKSDEDCPDCQTGDRRACYTGSKDTQGVGACRNGEQVCDPNGDWGPCQDDTLPAEETCNGKDDDCDGQIDNNLKDPPACDNNYGVCGQAKKSCKEGAWRKCEAANYGSDYEQDETKCDGKDNDCDGTIDENCPCTNDGETRACYGGPNGTKGVGTCKEGQQSCTSGKWTGCTGEIKPADELCGDQQDNDCDGKVDEKIQYAIAYNKAYTSVKGDAALKPADAITVEGWFNVASIAQRDSHGLISIAQSGGYAIQINQPRSGRISFRVWPLGGQAYVDASADTKAIKVGTWQHIAGTYDGTYVRLWIDGKKVAETEFKGQIGYNTKDIPLLFGAESDEGGPNRRFPWYFAGQIAQVRISNKAVYDKDFTPDCMLTKGNDTVGLWLFNSGSGSTAKDELGQHDGTHRNIAVQEAIRCPGYGEGGCKTPPPAP